MPIVELAEGGRLGPCRLTLKAMAGALVWEFNT
jgi:hypothetical protein